MTGVTHNTKEVSGKLQCLSHRAFVFSSSCAALFFCFLFSYGKYVQYRALDAALEVGLPSAHVELLPWLLEDSELSILRDVLAGAFETSYGFLISSMVQKFLPN